VDLEADESLTAIYVTQYYVTANPDAVNFQSGWYNNGTLVSKSVNGSLTVNGPVNLAVMWGLGYIPYISLAIVAAVVIGAFLLLQARRTRGKTTEPVNELATSETLTETTVISPDKPTATEETVVISKTMFCNQCGAKIRWLVQVWFH
jgi:hypothetical protein